MNEQSKQMLLALIEGLTKTRGSSQYYAGEKYMDENGLKILKKTISNL